MSIWGKISEALKVRHKNSSQYENTVTEGEYLDDPDIYIKYEDNKAILLFTNSDNEWSTFETLHPQEREKYVSDMTQITLYLSTLHNQLTNYERGKKIVKS